MAFPSIRSQATSSVTVAETTHTINLPATVRAGDTIFVFIQVTVAGAITWPDATWNELFDNSTAAYDDQIAGAWKKATGSESGTTISITTASGKFVAISIAVQDATDPTLTAPTLGTIATGSATEPDPGNCNPGSAKDYLWWTFYGMEGEQTGITAYPTNFTLNQSGIVTTGTAGAVTTNCTAASAARQFNAASLDVGVWDVTGTLDDWAAYTIAFHPAEPVTVPLDRESDNFTPTHFPKKLITPLAVLTIAVNLLQTTLAPPLAPPALFSEKNWPNPLYAKKLNPYWNQDKPQYYIDEVTAIYYQGQEVLLFGLPSFRSSELTVINNLLQTTLAPVEEMPFITNLDAAYI
jgi:hypothetical protein